MQNDNEGFDARETVSPLSLSDEDLPPAAPYLVIYEVRPKLTSVTCLPHSGFHGIAVEIVGTAVDVNRFTCLAVPYSTEMRINAPLPQVFHSIGPYSANLLIWTHHCSADTSRRIYPDHNVRIVKTYLKWLVGMGIYTDIDMLPTFGCQYQIYKRIETWTEIISWNSFKLVFELDWRMQRNGVDDNIEKLFKVNKHYLYSVWKPGEVPVEVIQLYHLFELCSHDDREAYQQWLIKRRIQNKKVLELD
jgi:hypothetical protein